MVEPLFPAERLRQRIATWSGPVHWIEDTPGAWTAAWEGKEALVRALTETSFEARVWHHPTGPDGPDPELTNGPVVFPTPDEALAYCEDEMGAPLP
ncbi:MAG: hypothetical protein QOE80_3049 [Actinomycetota bacterium]|jgi:hypothetical protein|nr:hypothetical protein [Actinomycetota bacterium]